MTQVAKGVSIPPDSQYDELDMRKPIRITAPWPTPEEWAKHFPISKASEKAIQALVDEFKARLCNRERAPASSREPEKRRKSASTA